MTTITAHTKQCTLINVFTVSPEQQQELVDTLVAATEQVIRALPGFISANIHKSVDGVRVTNHQLCTVGECGSASGNARKP